MDFTYVAYTRERKIVRGKVSASNDATAAGLLNSSGYQVLSLKGKTGFFNSEKLNASLTNVNPKEVVTFSRQLALLLTSGTDIVASLDLLQSQVTNKEVKKCLGEVASDIRGGSSLSLAMRKHPKVFPVTYWRSISAGERSGNLDVVLRQMADYLERRILLQKKIKSALTYPIMVIIVAFIAVAVLVVFVMPTFAQLYSTFGSELPATTRIMISAANWAADYGLSVMGGFLVFLGAVFAASRTPQGKYRVDTTLLKSPVIGRIVNLTELSRACRTMALLFRVGLPLPDIMSLAVQSTTNKVCAENMSGVQRELIRGDGLSKPMSRRKFFLPLMVQMVSVGEETGNLDTTLNTVAETYEVEADDRTQAAVGLIQPIMTIGIGLLIGFIAISMVSAMYSLYGNIK